MATVTSQLTRINDLEGSLTSVSIGGGAGATANTDIFIQASQSLARRQSNVTLGGFLLDDGAGGNDLSAAGVHIGAWVWVTHYSVLTALRFRIGSNSGSGNYDEHIYPLSEYPALGGWVRVWIDVSRTPDATGGTALDEATARYFGPIVSLPTVGGNAQNVVLDAIDHTTGGLLLTGTSGVFADFVTADSNSTNQYGVVESRSEVIFCRARLVLGSSTSLDFSDSNFVIVFPQQDLVASTFMGLTVDLQNASTFVEMVNGSIQSPGVKKGDLLVSGTSGSLVVTSCTLTGLRAIDLTSACDFDGVVIQGCGQVAAGGAYLVGCTFDSSTATAALLWSSSDTDTRLDGSRFVSGGSGHAIEFASGTPSSITLDDVTFTGYGADGTTDAAIYNNTGGALTVNVIGGSTPTVRNGTGASTTVVAGAVTASVKVVDIDGDPIANARVHLVAASGGGLPYNVSVTITNSGTTATVTHAVHGLSTGDKVMIRGASHPQNNGVFSITVTNAGTYTYTMPSAPGSDPTGTITSTFAVLSGLTDVSGYITMSRVFPADQPVTGRARKSTAPPYYRTAQIVGTVSSSLGFSTTILMIEDQ